MKPLAVRAVQLVAGANMLAVRALTVLMLVVLTLQVFMRSVLNAPPSWTEEVALLAFSWAVLLGVAYGVREGIHVRMDMLLDALPPALNRWLERLVLVAVGGVGAYLLLAGWHYTESAAGTTSAAISYPMPLLYASVVVCGALVLVFAVERLLLGLPAGTAPDPAQGTS